MSLGFSRSFPEARYSKKQTKRIQQRIASRSVTQDILKILRSLSALAFSGRCIWYQPVFVFVLILVFVFVEKYDFCRHSYAHCRVVLSPVFPSRAHCTFLGFIEMMLILPCASFMYTCTVYSDTQFYPYVCTWFHVLICVLFHVNIEHLCSQTALLLHSHWGHWDFSNI